MEEPYPGDRAWTTVEVPFFAPNRFYALLDTTVSVELIDVVDTEFEWMLRGDDGPDD